MPTSRAAGGDPLAPPTRRPVDGPATDATHAAPPAGPADTRAYDTRAYGSADGRADGGAGAGTVRGAGADDGLEAALTAARQGDEHAFAALYRDLQPRLVRYAGGLVGQDADDVTAEAWLQIARDLRGFSGDLDDFRGWTARIVRNRAIDQLRARNRRPADPTDALELFDRPAGDDTAAQVDERMTTAAALALIAELPPDQAEAVLLRVVVGLDAAGAAAVLGKRPGTVRVASHRGLKSLARRLEQRRDLRGDQQD